MLLHEQITEGILGAAIEVHGTLGPGLLESAYEECLVHEFRLRKIEFQRQVALPISYKGISLDCGYRMDIAGTGWTSSSKLRLSSNSSASKGSFLSTRRNRLPICD